jgi:hypothetical protein
VSLSWLTEPIQNKSVRPYTLLDSGVYAVWRSGAVVPFDRYLEYCAKVKDITLACVNYDVIPGAWGRKAAAEEIEAACERSFQNYCELTKTGALIMPVFHQTDSLRWLDRYLETGVKYIAMSPTDSFATPARQEWVRQVHEYIEHHGVTLNRDVFTHCLGLFSPRAMYGLPAWSADASTLLRWVAWKRVLIPKFKNGKIDGFDGVPVSSKGLIAGAVNEHPLIDWDAVRAWFDANAVPYAKHSSGRLILDDPHALTAASIAVVRCVMAHTGIRCYIAGTHPPAIYTVTVDEQYPYILRSYAVIKERTGATIRAVWDRNIERPRIKPEKNHKVEITRGLFSL